MYLKKLESVGFKSFAERISVDFVPGVTAVVGPNGSGKSNITDAIRWVLGEQSAKSLRGSKMQDIIFAGSDSRKPLNVAEVTLTLDNKDQRLPIDYEEVAVTRRVYRSGESEYLINKQSCRLKDIVDLFLDSGLGKEAFSIIGQGRVEEILSSKSEERRSIFEEAAGVLKYKKRKQNAEKKLVDTEDNLSRVEDIIHEIEGQLEPLQEQSSIAKEYLEKKDELEQYEVSLLVTEIESYHNDWQNLLNQIDDKKQHLLQIKTEINKDDAQLETYRKQISELDEKIEAWQEDKLSLTQQIEQLDGKRNLLTEQLKHFDESKERLTNQIEAHQDQIDQYELDVEDHEKKWALLKSQRDETTETIEKIKTELTQTGSQVEEEIESLKAQYIDLLNEQAAKKNEKLSIEKQIDQANHRKQRLDDRFKELIENREALQDKEKSFQSEVEQQRETLRETQRQIGEMESSIQELLHDVQEDEGKKQEAYRLIDQLRSKQEMLEEMKSSYSGFYYGVKSVLQAAKRNELSGIHGAVAELVDIDEKYVTAIETALGGQAQNLVTTDEQAARQAINWLKKTNNGRATFLPMTSIRPRQVRQEDLKRIQHDGWIGIASDLVATDPAYDSIVKQLLGNIIITSDLKAANAIAKQTNHRYRMVTLDGDVVNPGGSMTGGAKKKSNQASLFTREKELEETTSKLARYEKRTKQFEEQLYEKQQQLEQLKADLSQLNERKSEQQEMMQTKEQELYSVSYQVSNLQDQLKVYDQENEQLDAEMNQHQSDLKEVTSYLADSEEETEALRIKIEDLTNNLSSYKEAHEQLRERLNHMQIRYAEQDSEVKNQKVRYDEALADLEEEKQAKQEKVDELKQLEASYEQQDTVENLTDHLKSNRQELLAVNENIDQGRENRQQITHKRDDLEREVKEKNRQYEKESHDVQKLEVHANRLDVELENRLEQLREDYMLTHERAREEYGITEDLEASREKVKLIKRSIDELGHVNLGAIEEYERIQERYDFLTSQQADLLEAKQTLYDVIAEMDQEMVRKFSDTFSKIQKEFTTVFQTLFGGGRAELELTDPEDLLETGVDITAQPPGKKLQHLSLLSGGERSLTAIALLFAILRVRPVPFCVLDEVEAALDEANVYRFANYLREFSAETQFIVITHRKGTMELADVLYGVTMQESGVSKLVSVKLEETKDMILS